MNPSQALVQIALGMINGGMELIAKRQQAEAEGREIEWEDVDLAMKQNDALRVEFEARRQSVEN